MRKLAESLSPAFRVLLERFFLHTRAACFAPEVFSSRRSRRLGFGMVTVPHARRRSLRRRKPSARESLAQSRLEKGRTAEIRGSIGTPGTGDRS
jgi:hypothetical protein